MEIDLLYFDDCPSWQSGLENLKIALEAEGSAANIRLMRVKDDVEAARLKFLGSPSFQANDLNLWPEECKQLNLSCRVYIPPQGIKSAPTVEVLREKLCAQIPKDS